MMTRGQWDVRPPRKYEAGSATQNGKRPKQVLGTGGVTNQHLSDDMSIWVALCAS